jgi:hypothetical protein
VPRPEHITKLCPFRKSRNIRYVRGGSTTAEDAIFGKDEEEAYKTVEKPVRGPIRGASKIARLPLRGSPNHFVPTNKKVDEEDDNDNNSNDDFNYNASAAASNSSSSSEESDHSFRKKTLEKQRKNEKRPKRKPRKSKRSQESQKGGQGTGGKIARVTPRKATEK